MMTNSACIHKKIDVFLEKCSRATSGKFLPVAIPSLADKDCIKTAIKLEKAMTQSNKYPYCEPAVIFVAKFPGSI